MMIDKQESGCGKHLELHSPKEMKGLFIMVVIMKASEGRGSRFPFKDKRAAGFGKGHRQSGR